jgi:hypothetical protein
MSSAKEAAQNTPLMKVASRESISKAIPVRRSFSIDALARKLRLICLSLVQVMQVTPQLAQTVYPRQGSSTLKRILKFSRHLSARFQWGNVAYQFLLNG